MGLTPSDSAYIKMGTLHEYPNLVYGKSSGFKLGNPAYPRVKVNVMSETLSEHTKTIGSDKYEKWGTKFW